MKGRIVQEERNYFNLAREKNMRIPVLLLVLLTVFPVCSSAAEGGGEEGAYPLTVTTYDFHFKPVACTFTRSPQRVLVDGKNNVELLLRLGLGARIILAAGVTAVADDLSEEFARIPQMTGLPGKERAIALQPDFILAWYGLFSEKALGDVSFWHERGINTWMSLNSYARGPHQPRTLEAEYQDILTVGRIFGVTTRSEELVSQMKQEIDRAKKYFAGRPPQRIAILEVGDNGSLRVYGHNQLVGDMAHALGASFALGEEGYLPLIGAEHLILANPDSIFVVYYGSATPEKAVAQLTDNPAFANLAAIRGGRVFPLALNSIYCSGLRTFDGIRSLAKGLYPELYR